MATVKFFTEEPSTESVDVAAAAIGAGGIFFFLVVVTCMCVWVIVILKCCNGGSLSRSSQATHTSSREPPRVHNYPASEGIFYSPRTVKFLLIEFLP